jgi:hypothetical protein
MDDWGVKVLAAAVFAGLGLAIRRAAKIERTADDVAADYLKGLFQKARSRRRAHDRARSRTLPD